MHNYQCSVCGHTQQKPNRLPMHTGKCEQCGGKLLHVNEEGAGVGGEGDAHKVAQNMQSSRMSSADNGKQMRSTQERASKGSKPKAKH